MEAVTSQGTARWAEHTSGEVWSEMTPHVAEETTRTFSHFNSPKLAAGLAALGHFFQAVLSGTSLGIMPNPLNCWICRPHRRCADHNTICPSKLLRYCKTLAVFFPSGFVFHSTLCDGISVHDQQLRHNINLTE